MMMIMMMMIFLLLLLAGSILKVGFALSFKFRFCLVHGVNVSLDFIHSFIFILPLTRNTTTVYRNTLKIIYNIPTKLLQDQMW